MKKKPKVHLIIGTRPEAIKTAPVYKALADRRELDTRLISTGQHRELLGQALGSFGLKPSHDLQIMREKQTLSQLTANLLVALEGLFLADKPDLILAHGDTTTCYASALSAFYHGIPFFHLEAGLRTFRLDSPFPEEFNRQCITKMASHHFATSDEAHANLLEDGVNRQAITVTGNTLYDAIEQMSPNGNGSALLRDFGFNNDTFSKTVLFTLHRRAQGSSSLKPVMDSLKQVAKQNPQACFIFPVHPSPSVRDLAKEVFSNSSNVMLSPPLEYPEFLTLMLNSSLVLTDSGGVQEEAAYLGKKVFVLRDFTERGDGISKGTTQIIGTDPAEIFARTNEELKKSHSKQFAQSSASQSPSRIVADVVMGRCSA